MGIIITGVVLFAIVMAFIFNGKFRKDVIASEGEAAVFGLINVKGVIIVLIIAIFGGLLGFLVQLDLNVQDIDITNARAINQLSESNEDQYSLSHRGDNWVISSGGVEIGMITLDTNSDLSATKSPTNSKHWYVGKDGSKYGLVSTRVDQEQILFDYEHFTSFYTKKPYEIGNLKLRFIIDSIYAIHFNGRTKYNYIVRFGEQVGNRDIAWGRQLEYEKSADGEIRLANGLKQIQEPKWENNYFVGIGLGQPTYDSVHRVYPGVDKLNLIAVESKVE